MVKHELYFSSMEMKNKFFFAENYGNKGLSTIVTTVILVALALVAIGVIWAVIGNLLGKSSGDISSSSACLKIDLKIVNADCTTPTACQVTLSRGAGGDEFSGVKLIFSDDLTSKVVDAPGNIEPLFTITVTKDSGFSTTAPNKVEIAPYFTEGGEEKSCQKSAPFDF